jgi:hypothetical protein
VCRDTVTVSDPPGLEVATIERELARVFGQDVALGIQLGPPRANRKPVLQILDERGRPLGVGKLAVSPLTRRLLTAERTALEVLSTMNLHGIVVPEVVHFGAWNETLLLVMSALPLAGASADVPEPLREAAMVILARAAGTSRQHLESSDYVRRLRVLADRVPDYEVRSRAHEVLGLVSARSGPWQFGSWHGDWTSWNTAYLGGQVLLWDWERFETGVPLGWDALHYALRRDLDTQPASAEVALRLLARAPQLLAAFGVHPGDATDVAHCYLVALALRYAGDRQALAGEPTARVTDWLLPVLPRS